MDNTLAKNCVAVQRLCDAGGRVPTVVGPGWASMACKGSGVRVPSAPPICNALTCELHPPLGALTSSPVYREREAAATAADASVDP
jgi:hypothetical protein